MNLSRLNHVLIPPTWAERRRFERHWLGRLARPGIWLYGALSDEGRALIVLALVAGVLGLDVARSSVYLVWCLLTGLLAASLALRRPFALSGVSVELHVPRRVAPGEPLSFTLELRNAGERTHHGLRVRGPFLPWDGRWDGPSPALPTLAAGGAARVTARAAFSARGEHHLGPFSVAPLVPLGLAHAPGRTTEDCRFLVLPAIAPVRRVWLPETHRYQPGGVALASKTGESLELMGVRPYRPGDSVRARGAPPGYLRGTVYTWYHRGRWLAAGREPGAPARLDRRPLSGPAATELLPVEAPEDRWLLPLGVGEVAVEAGDASWTTRGLLVPGEGPGVGRLWYRPGDSPAAPLAGPKEADLQVPEALAEPLARLAASWTAGRSSVRDRLAALERRLQRDFTYSLEHERATDADPVLDFLQHHPVGHCEYFASAMALLARTRGIPTRVVGGFAGSEANSLTGDHLVRKRDAHAWVEAWVEGEGWGTWDPTPPGAPGRRQDRELGLAAALLDWAAAGWAAALEALELRHLAWAGGALAALLLGVLTVRRLLRRLSALGGARRRRTEDPPLPCLVTLTRALAGAGLSRSPSETLARFAGRVGDAPQLGGRAAKAATLLRRYAALRYGGRGRPRRLATEMEACAQAVASRQ